MTSPSDGQRHGERVGQSVDLAGTAGDPLGDQLALARHAGRRPAASVDSALSGVAAAMPRGQVVEPAPQAARDDGVAGPRRRPGWRPARGRPGLCSSTGSSRSPIGRRVVESGTPGPGADERRLEHPGVGAPPRDDDVVRARRLGQLVDDRAQDRVGRHGARQARQDARERLGLLATADLERSDGLAVADGREADDRDEADDGPVERPRIGDQRGERDEAEDEERCGEDPPGASDATFRGFRGSRLPACGVRSRQE